MGETRETTPTHNLFPPWPSFPATQNKSVEFSLLFWDASLGEYTLRNDLVLIYEMSRQYHVDVMVNSIQRHTFGAGGLHKQCVHVERQPYDILTRFITEDVSIRVKDPFLAVEWLGRASRTKAKFKVYQYKFLIPGFVEEWIEEDDDCMAPETWKNLFCSKFVLLFLRYCHKTGNLDADEERLQELWTVNSNQCTPAFLKRLVLHIFHYLQI
jgi:hypothetical protein